MTPPPLWDRIRRARIVQVLVVYLGASWGVLQIADTLTEALSLPEPEGFSCSDSLEVPSAESFDFVPPTPPSLL